MLLLTGGSRPGSWRGDISVGGQAVFSFYQQTRLHPAALSSPNTEAKMRVIIPTLAGLLALAATSVQAAPVPTNHAKWRETPAHNVRKSQQYDYLVSTSGNFRAYRMRKECGPIRDPELRNSCLVSFSEY